ncbi:magnesium-translocating P-type ATPase [Candidatus Saccharibacteria bacterium]|nr:magnesium-translocating P-type ATPase [Candidatus Saccharibacteria bacterium]
MDVVYLNIRTISGVRPLMNKDGLELNLRRYSALDTDHLQRELGSSADGLTSRQAKHRLEENGPNTISTDIATTFIARLLEAIINPFNIVLLAIAAITFVTDVVLSEEQDFLTFGIIIGLVIISSLIAFVQGEKSNRAADKLSKMIVNTASVKRNGEFAEVNMEDLVVGDVVKLTAGDMIPADVRFLTTKDTFIAQAALTGESNPVEKFADRIGRDDTALTDLPNIGFMGSNVVSGVATAVIVAAGNNTYFGGMAKSLSGSRNKNSFEKGIDSVSRLLIRMMLIMVPIVIIVNGVTKSDWIGSVLFAISIAVGLTPEMLPVIMTTTLATGAIKMTKYKVIVKNMGSIQAFGEMDVLCTDKTGTLTEDRIVLEKYININDEDDPEVLRCAYLNSYFQTSLRNMIDEAIIARADEDKLHEVSAEYSIFDEIPYDFERRRMSVVLSHECKDDYIISKGSVEEMLLICKKIRRGNRVVEIDARVREKIDGIYEKYTSEGMRMIAIAEKKTKHEHGRHYSVKDEIGMTIVGFIGFLDPPKESAAEAVRALYEHGIRTVTLTGDSMGVATSVCEKVGIDASLALSGAEVEKMSDEELYKQVEACSIFYKVSPSQKERIVKTLQANEHTVGYLGDGINDALPLKQADVGISVDNAVDIAKETASIILLEKDLLVLEEGVVQGRKTFGNIIKYIKMATSGNFGNMFSVVIASIFLPFLPMLPIHILVQNLICDFSQLGMPFDNVDEEFVEKPRKWDARSIKRFMFVMGPISSIFDVLCFVVLFFIIHANTVDAAPLFQAGWFVFGTVSQVLIIHMIRTAKRPFFDSNASKPLIASTTIAVIIALWIAFSDFAPALNMMRLPVVFVAWLMVLLAGYSLTVQIAKRIYIKKYGEWL